MDVLHGLDDVYDGFLLNEGLIRANHSINSVIGIFSKAQILDRAWMLM